MLSPDLVTDLEGPAAVPLESFDVLSPDLVSDLEGPAAVPLESFDVLSSNSVSDLGGPAAVPRTTCTSATALNVPSEIKKPPLGLGGRVIETAPEHDGYRECTKA